MFRLYLPFLSAALVALIMFVGFSILDIVIFNQKPHAELPPQFDGYHLVRLFACILASVWLVRSLPKATPNAPKVTDPLAALLLWLFTVIFIASPATFTALAIEDSLVEWTSAILVFLACFMFLWASVRLRKSGQPGASIAIALAMAVLLFVLGMEEVSWFQRVFGFETPETFASNGQREFNLHNFQTNKIENLYYIGAFVLLFLLPILIAPIRDGLSNSLKAVAPTQTVALSCVPMTALNWDMWNIIPIQMMFWVAVFSLATATTGLYRQQKPAWRVFAFILLSVFGCQMIYLALGSAFTRQWDVTEYKELFISIGFFVYASQTLTKAK